ncbi:uncharacterized protein LOC112053310 [Bicyclus anynana]|uniref:Uncharacterized protein LOC112053310 n=1 Tax=Bicyclus anynana TaxID=110368 RepID=A0ABM3LLP0_BICAN|nr:uncharacterized protein LOC112053310 [Bicyclus anynana]
MEVVARDIPRTVTSPEDIPVISKVTSLNQPDGGPMTAQASAENSSLCTLACDQSLLSGNVDRWMGVNSTRETSTGVQGSRPALAQRSTLVTDGHATWYMLAVTLMPILSLAHPDQWRCSPSAILNAMEVVLSHMNITCNRVIRQLAENQISRDILAGVMDMILIMYYNLSRQYGTVCVKRKVVLGSPQSPGPRADRPLSPLRYLYPCHNIYEASGCKLAVDSAVRACSMFARAVAVAALCACAISTASAIQPQARIYIDVAPKRTPRPTRIFELDDVEKRYTPELVQELEATKDNALLLYTEYSSASAGEMKAFLRNISSLLQDTIRTMETRVLDRANRRCRDEFDANMRKIETDAQRAAAFSGENHHKYFLGHMIVFRMHLNKSQDYVQRCQKINRGCGTPCETTPRMVRWRRLAMLEINRVKDDIQHSRRSYKDLLVHARRKLRHLRIEAQLRAKTAIAAVEQCVKNTTC